MEDFLLTHGLWTFGLMIFVDELGLPFFPNGIALFTVATLAPTIPEMHVWQYAILGILVAQTGQFLLFFGGRHGLRKWVKKHHFRLMPSEERLTKLKLFFTKKHGFWNIIGISCVSTIRPYVALIAGSTGMSAWKYFPFSIIGTTIFATSITAGGYFIGNALLEMFHGNKTLIMGILLILLILWYFKSRFPWNYFTNNKS